MRVSKLALSSAAFGVVVGMSVVVANAGSAAAVVVANGTVSCTTLAGSVTFTPPLETTGDTKRAKAAVRLSLKTCHYTTTNIGHGTVTGTDTVPITTITSNKSANACANLSNLRPIAQTIVWHDSNGTPIAPTIVAFSGFDPLYNPSPLGSSSYLGFHLPQNVNGKASIAPGGSFAGIDAGASSQANIWADITFGALTRECGAAGGLKVFKLGHAGTISDPSQAVLG